MVRGVRFAAADGTPVLEVVECVGDRSLWRLLGDQTTFGTLVLNRPVVRLALDPDKKNNIARAVEPAIQELDDVRELLQRDIPFSIIGRVELREGQFVFQRSPERPEVMIDIADVALKVKATEDGAIRHLSLEPGPLLERQELTPDLCNDLVKFAAPVLAESTWTQGSLSLDTDGGEFPLREPIAWELRGRLTIHDITAGTGPLATEIARLYRLPEQVQLVDESVIEFGLTDGVVQHDGLEFQLGKLRVVSEGQVRLDESMQLVSRIVFPAADESSSELARRLAGRHIQLPIAGTLTAPRLDWQRIAVDHPFLDEFVARLLDPDDTPVLDVLRDIRQRRRDLPPEPGDRLPGRRLLRMLLDSDKVPASPSEPRPNSSEEGNLPRSPND